MGAAQFHLQPLANIADGYIGQFRAMGSPCEVLLRNCSDARAKACLDKLYREVVRIERKFSRYRDDTIVAEINHSEGRLVRIDSETERLLETADALWQISEGLFDITSGCLRRAWVFDRSDRLPEAEMINALLRYVGWQHVERSADSVRLPPGFEIDFGGIGKEYASDRCLQIAREMGMADVLVNLGGDIAAASTAGEGEAWSVGIESVQAETAHNATLHFSNGGIATSGDANKYLFKDGQRYSHVLNPRTGWPVQAAPRSITVAAASCSEAGMYSTLAMLRGSEAEMFLNDCDIQYWIQNED